MQTWMNGSCVAFGSNSQIQTRRRPGRCSCHRCCKTIRPAAVFTAIRLLRVPIQVSAKFQSRRWHSRPVGGPCPRARARCPRPRGPRATCTTVQVVSGDGLCVAGRQVWHHGRRVHHIQPGREPFAPRCWPVSTSAARLARSPIMPPPPNADGSCATHEVVADDTCSYLAATYSNLTIVELESYNTNT